MITVLWFLSVNVKMRPCFKKKKKKGCQSGNSRRERADFPQCGFNITLKAAVFGKPVWIIMFVDGPSITRETDKLK